MQLKWTVLVVAVLAAACGDGGGEGGQDASASDGSAVSMDSTRGPDAGEPDHAAHDAAGVTDAGADMDAFVISRRAVESYDRAANAQCACFVADGVYESQQECFVLLGSGDDWAGCGADVFEGVDSPELRATIDCFIERSEAQAECYEAAACDADALAACSVRPLECLMTQLDVVLTLLMRCPDLGLLSRVSP